MEMERLQYLADRLEAIGSGESLEAAELVRRVIQAGPSVWNQPEAEHALYHSVGHHLSRALDHEDFDASKYWEVDALEAEMSGRIHFYRLSRGWLTRAPGAPTDFRPITDFIHENPDV